MTCWLAREGGVAVAERPARLLGPRAGTQTDGAVESPDMRRVPPPSVPLAPVRGRRRPWLVALGAFLAATGALLVVWMVGAAGQRQEVLVLRQDVPYGQQVTNADLAVTRVSVDPGVEVVPAADRDRVAGLVAATTLTAGALLTPASVETAGEPGPGRVLVPVPLPAERLPAGGLRPGDRILAVGTASAESPASTLAVPSRVVRVGSMDVNGVSVVDVSVASQDGSRLAVAAAQGAVAIVVQPSGG